MKKMLRWFVGAVGTCGIALVAPADLTAHCDGLDGPVVKAAERALESGNVALVLVWVQASDEPEIRAAFTHVREVRALGGPAKTLADRYFFETLVRVHRVGEGAPFTGLQPAGRDLGPAIPAADKALDSNSVDPLVALLTAEMAAGLRERFREAMAARAFPPTDVAAGREYVKAYVEFIHYVERLHDAAVNPAHGHYDERR